MTTTTEKQATGYVMTYDVTDDGDGRFYVRVRQNGNLVFGADGCSSIAHAEQIARDIMVRYALTKRPTI